MGGSSPEGDQEQYHPGDPQDQRQVTDDFQLHTVCSSPQIALHDIISYLKSLVSRKTKDLAYKQEKSVKNARFTGGKETGILR